MVYDYLSSFSYLHISIFVIIGINYPVEGKEGGGGGFLDGGVPSGSPNPESILVQKMSSFRPVFRPGLQEITLR